jgi:c-di-AMP phosphodiesterase-like protein
MSKIILPVTGIIAMSIASTIMIMSKQYFSGTLLAIATINFVVALCFSIRTYGYEQQRKILSDLREEISNGGK